MSKQKQLHVRKSYKTHKSPLPCIGNYEENIDLSRIHLAVLMKFRLHGKLSQSQMRKFEEIPKTISCRVWPHYELLPKFDI